MADTPGALLGPAEIRELAGRLGVRPTKTLGQNFVHDHGTVRKIVRAAGVRPGQRVVEVGPGLGSLTLGLLEAGASVVAVEIDPLLAGEIEATVRRHAPGADFTVVLADAMDVTSLPGPPPTALVANLPYNVAVPVLLTMLERFASLESVLVMVQAEVADRIAAAPGSKVYGVPSVKAAWYARAWRSLNVSRTVFWPVPNVDSALVALERREPPVTEASREQVFAVVDAAFAQRRKTLRAALSGLFGSGAAAEEALRAAGVDPSARGETLDVVAFARIAEQWVRGGGGELGARRGGAVGASVQGADGGAARRGGAPAVAGLGGSRGATADGVAPQPVDGATAVVQPADDAGATAVVQDATDAGAAAVVQGATDAGATAVVQDARDGVHPGGSAGTVEA